MKTNKHKTLRLARKLRSLHSRDLVQRFDYSPGTARSYLSHLGRQGLLERVNSHYELTKKGHQRVRYFDIFGCTHRVCPLCQGKLGFLTCPDCENRVLKQKATLREDKDLFFVRRRAGVYCEECSAMILDEIQARQLGIPEEK